MSGEKIAGWVLFHVFVFIMLVVDMKVLHRKAHEIRMKEALWWSVIWVLIALAFNAGIYFWHPQGRVAAVQFLSGYVIERSLSIDNIFVFLLIFNFFRVPGKFQHAVLFWGILGALVMRGLFIFAGVTLITRIHWVIYIFGAFLIYTGLKLLFQQELEVHPEKSRVLRLVYKIFPVLPTFEGGRFFVRRDGKNYATMLFVVLVFIEATDVLFAVDSIPAIIAVVPNDMFIAYTSNIFAIFGLRALYFAVAGLMQLFHYLNYGLSAILVFVGIKMLIGRFYEIPDLAALGVIGAILLLSILCSVIWPRKDAHELPGAGEEEAGE